MQSFQLDEEDLSSMEGFPDCFRICLDGGEAIGFIISQVLVR